MNYFRPITTADGLTVSVDNIIIDYHIGNQRDRDELARILSDLDMKFAVRIRHWSSLRIGTFRENITISFQDGASFWLGVGLNEVKPNFGRVRIEANPAHCAAHRVFWYLLGWLNESAGAFRTKIKRFDLAVDCTAERADVELLKDHRAYSEIRKSRQDRTQYVGQRSTGSRAKCYNKALESKLTTPLTRLELTLDPAVPYQEINWPRAYVIRSRQARIDELAHLTDTERTLLDGVLAGTIDLTRLGRKTRMKIEQYMNGYVQWLTVTASDYKKVLDQLYDLRSYPRCVFRPDIIHMDELPHIKATVPAWIAEAEQADNENYGIGSEHDYQAHTDGDSRTPNSEQGVPKPAGSSGGAPIKYGPAGPHL